MSALISNYFNDEPAADPTCVLRRSIRPAPLSADAPEASKGATPAVACDHTLIGHCSAMREVFKAIDQVARHDVNVLITGETGTGKELVARAIHNKSGRDGPYLALNCTAIPETLLESELFGHEKGAFSGADRRRVGKFEQCDGGTILLDEIGDMPLPLQAKILRLLQEQTFERVGGNATLRTNVRVIASTHRGLKALCASGGFREDLYYRLNGFTIHLPSLRDRQNDLQTLVQHFVRHYAARFDRATPSVAPSLMDRLRSYAWPGNVRELQGMILRALLRNPHSMLTANDFPELEIGDEAEHSTDGPRCFDVGTFLDKRLTPNANDLYSQIHRELDRIALSEVLKFTQGNQHLAAKILGIARQTLRIKMHEAGVQVVGSVLTDRTAT